MKYVNFKINHITIEIAKILLFLLPIGIIIISLTSCAAQIDKLNLSKSELSDQPTVMLITFWEEKDVQPNLVNNAMEEINPATTTSEASNPLTDCFGLIAGACSPRTKQQALESINVLAQNGVKKSAFVEGITAAGSIGSIIAPINMVLIRIL